MAVFFELNQVLTLDNRYTGVAEKFKITKIGRKYLYLESEQYGSDGVWWTTKIDPKIAERV